MRTTTQAIQWRYKVETMPKNALKNIRAVYLKDLNECSRYLMLRQDKISHYTIWDGSHVIAHKLMSEKPIKGKRRGNHKSDI